MRKGRVLRSSASKTQSKQKRKSPKTKTLTVLKDKEDEIMMDVVKVKTKRELKRVYFEIDGKIARLKDAGRFEQRHLTELVEEAYDKTYRTSDEQLGKLIREKSERDKKYKKQIAGMSDKMIGKMARPEIDKIISKRKKYIFDKLLNHKVPEVSTAYQKMWMVSQKDKDKEISHNKGTFDWWSVRHFIGGFIIGLAVPNHRLGMLGAGVAFELGEEYVAQQQPEASGAHETLANKGVDLIANQLGYELGSAVRNTFDK